MSRWIARGLVGVAVGALVGSSLCPQAFADEQVVEGEIVDPAAYLKDGRHGPEQVDQTYEAVDGGQTLALLDGSNTLHVFLAPEAGEDPNELVYDYVNQQVKVTGTLYERGGLKGIVVASVEPVAAPSATSAGEPASSDTSAASSEITE